MKNEIQELNMTLNRLYREQDDLYHEYASHFGLSSISFWILYTLCETEEEAFTQNMLADMWHIPRQSLNSAVRTLVNQGYIKLEQRAVSGNSKALRLTEEGKDFCKGAIYPFYELEERILQNMTKQERKQFLEFSVRQLEMMKKEIKAFIREDAARK